MTNRRRRPESIIGARKRKRVRNSKICPIALEEYQKLKKQAEDPPMLYYCTEKVDNDQRRNLVVDGGKLEHRDQALKREHPLDRSRQLPSLPVSLEAAIGAYKSMSAEEIITKRQELLQMIEKRAESLQLEASKVREGMHPDIQKVAGHINIPLLKELLCLCEYPDVSLADDMLNGFAVIGDIRVADGVFAPIHEHSPAELSRDELLNKAELERERLISKIRSRSFDPDVWNGTIKETEDELLEGPLTIDETQRRYGKFVLAQRFPIKQVDKIRLCDDYRRSSTNKAISYGHKISLPSHHTLVESWRRLAKDRPHEQYLLYKCDHANAYRQAPTKPRDAPVQLICVKDVNGEPAVFRHRALSFGSSSSVTSYSRISQGITHLHRILFAAGSMSFIDDYWGTEPQLTAQSAFECWVELNRLLGFKEKPSKRVAPTAEAELLGIVVSFSRTKMSLTLPTSKRERLLEELRNLIAAPTVPLAALSKLCGKLVFASSTSPDFSWRAATRTLYRFTSKAYYQRHSLDLRHALGNILAMISAAPPTRDLHLYRDGSKPFVVYTDAESPGNRLAGVLYCPQAVSSRDRYYSEIIPEDLLSSLVPRKNQIVALELCAAVTAINTFKDALKGQCVWLYIDSRAAEYALIRGSSGKSDLNGMTAFLWRTAASYSISIWISRVPSEQNIADGPSRREYKDVVHLARVPAKWIRTDQFEAHK